MLKKIRNVKELQKEFVYNKRKFVDEFIKPLIERDEITSILLSGSLARGTFMPGEKGGAIDLIIFCTNTSNFDAEEILGKDLEENIPGHFIQYKNTYFQIKIYDDNYIENFKNHNEAEKYSFFESLPLYDNNNWIKEKLQNELTEIKNNEIPLFLRDNYYYSEFLINDYKVERWIIRNAIVQLNQNLTKSIELSLKNLFYLNNLYAPAEDRLLYFSYELDKKPENYDELIYELLLVKSMDIDDYKHREKIYKTKMLEFIKSEIKF